MHSHAGAWERGKIAVTLKRGNEEKRFRHLKFGLPVMPVNGLIHAYFILFYIFILKSNQ